MAGLLGAATTLSRRFLRFFTSGFLRPGSASGCRLSPEARAAQKSIGVVALAATLGQLLQFFYIASAENDIVGFEGGDPALNHACDMAPPFLFSPFFQAALADVILIGSFLVWKMGQFHRLDDTIADHGGTKAGSQPEAKHLAALVTSQGLHGCIVDHLDRAFERGLEIKSYPTAPEIMRFHQRTIPDDHSRVADGYRFILPVPGEFLNSSDHPLRRHGRPGRKPARLVLSGGENFDVGTANIDCQHIHDELSPRFLF